ncbi:MAG: hypothetical protein NTY35_13795 [Planctomycetota bacterium]|nr:hypothetical protein [Planctomycetota bacterium]
MASAADTRNRRLSLLATIGVCVLAVAHAWTWRACGPLDDDAILYRYGANLAHGLGLVFNPGERVEGFTAPPLVFFHAGVEGLGLDHVAASRVLGIGSVVAAVLLLSAAWRTVLPRSIVPWPALFVAAAPAVAVHAIAGLGTTLAMALVAAWLLGEVRRACEERAPRFSDFALGFAGLLRPELQLLAVVAAARLVLRREGRRAATTLAAPGVWLAFRLAWFGEWLPNTYHAKKLPLLEDLARGSAYFLHSAQDLLLPLVLVIAGVAWLTRNPPPLARWLSGAAIVASAGAVFVGGDHMPFSRLLVPGLPVFAFALFLHVLRSTGGLVAASSGIAVLAIGLVQFGQGERAERAASFDQLERRWQAVGAVLRERVPPGTLVATEAIGFVGYESRLPLLDMLGLVEPVIAHGAPHLEAEMKGHTKYDADHVLAREPGLILLGNGLLDADGRVPVFVSQRDLASHPRFAAEYEQAVIEVPGTYPLVYWKRRGN